MSDFILLLINIVVLIFVFTVSFIIFNKKSNIVLNKKEKSIYPDKERFVLIKNFIFFKKRYKKLLDEKNDLYKFENFSEEKEYFKIFSISFTLSFFFSINFLIIGEKAGMILIFLLTYFITNYTYTLFEYRKIKKYKTILTSESVGIMQQFTIYYHFIKNPIKIIKEILIPSNKNRESGRQLEKLVNEIENNPSKTSIEIISKFKKNLNGVIGMEIFLTLLQNTIEQGVISEKEVNLYSKNIINQKKLDKEKKIKETISILEIILIIFFILPISAILMLPTLLQKNGDFNLLDLMKAIIKY